MTIVQGQLFQPRTLSSWSGNSRFGKWRTFVTGSRYRAGFAVIGHRIRRMPNCPLRGEARLLSPGKSHERPLVVLLLHRCAAFFSGLGLVRRVLVIFQHLNKKRYYSLCTIDFRREIRRFPVSASCMRIWNLKFCKSETEINSEQQQQKS